MTAPVWTDVHCHVSEYPDPEAMLAGAAAASVAVYGSTVLPSEYRRLRDCATPVMGLGFHPMHAELPARADELAIFAVEAANARWLSEIGLDGWMPRVLGGPSLHSQELLLETLLAHGVGEKILSLHAREAEHRCAEMVFAARPGAAVFHWFKGDLQIARRIVDAGMLFSVNPMMVGDPGRAEFLRWVPADALLLETDGPQLEDPGADILFPSVLPAVAARLARLRGVQPESLAAAMRANLARIVG